VHRIVGSLALLAIAVRCSALAIIDLPVHRSDPEVEWADALASKLEGEREAKTAYGRVDVLTRSWAIEVERFAKYHEGMGQALHYHLSSGKLAVLALMLDEEEYDQQKAKYIDDALCRPLGLVLLLLRPVAEPVVAKQFTSPAPTGGARYWISSTGKTHREGCRYYGRGAGKWAVEGSGANCKVCGGAGG
jgi:hypothetical protein